MEDLSSCQHLAVLPSGSAGLVAQQPIPSLCNYNSYHTGSSPISIPPLDGYSSINIPGWGITPAAPPMATSSFNATPGSGQFPYRVPTPGAYLDTSNSGRESQWCGFKVLAKLFCNGQELNVSLRAKIGGKDFHNLSQENVCYRRNYFLVEGCSTLSMPDSNVQIHIQIGDRLVPVQALAIRLSAVTDGNRGEDVGVVKFTAKRKPDDDNGKGVVQTVIWKCPSSQTATPQQDIQETLGTNPHLSYLAHQHGESSGDYNLSNHLHNSAALAARTDGFRFQRIQFRKATANNGKKRPSQQHYHIVVSLVALIDKEDDWRSAAELTSVPIVVRGRSPGHYQNEREAHRNDLKQVRRRRDTQGPGGVASYNNHISSIGDTYDDHAGLWGRSKDYGSTVGAIRTDSQHNAVERRDFGYHQEHYVYPSQTYQDNQTISAFRIAPPALPASFSCSPSKTCEPRDHLGHIESYGLTPAIGASLIHGTKTPSCDPCSRPLCTSSTPMLPIFDRG